MASSNKWKDEVNVTCNNLKANNIAKTRKQTILGQNVFKKGMSLFYIEEIYELYHNLEQMMIQMSPSKRGLP